MGVGSLQEGTGQRSVCKLSRSQSIRYLSPVITVNRRHLIMKRVKREIANGSAIGQSAPRE